MLTNLGEDITIRVKKKPFRHVVMDGVFKREVYKGWCEAFNERLNRGTVDKFQQQKFWKFGHYDAFCYSICPDRDKVFGDIVYDPIWKRFINGFFGHNLTKNVLAELHHHKVGSESGYTHNDYDVASFKNEPMENGTNAHKHQVNYRGRAPDSLHCVRSIALLYYFNNEKWTEDAGGTTAFFKEENDKKPVKVFPPVVNRLMAFEVSPLSFHTYLTNKKIVRNSLVMWFHCPEKWAIQRYGENPK